ncbi:MAG TPA: dUTP diphosphatase [Gemmatimonadaceae bacterium]
MHETNGDAPSVVFEKLYPDVELPSRATAGAAGYDIRAYLTGSRTKLMSGSGVVERGPDPEADVPFITLLPRDRAIIPTGFKVALPEGFEMQVRPRSGTSFKKGLEIINAPGTVDEDYRGEVGILVRNGTELSMVIEHGERIAQVVFSRVAHPVMREGVVDETARGAGGFGSTGPR